MAMTCMKTANPFIFGQTSSDITINSGDIDSSNNMLACGSMTHGS